MVAFLKEVYGALPAGKKHHILASVAGVLYLKAMCVAFPSFGSQMAAGLDQNDPVSRAFARMLRG